MLSGYRGICFFRKDAVICIVAFQRKSEIPVILTTMRWVGDEFLNQISDLGIVLTLPDRKEDYAAFNVLIIPEE